LIELAALPAEREEECTEGREELELTEPERSRREPAAEPVERMEGGLTCERMEWREPCSEAMNPVCMNWGYKHVSI